MPQDQFGGTYIDDVDEFGGVLISEESIPPEREDYVSAPPAPPTFGEGPEDIPPGMTAGLKPRLSDEEWGALRKKIALRDEGAGLRGEAEGLATLEMAATVAQQPIVPAGIAEAAMALSTPALPPGVRRSVAEAASGLTSPVNIGMAVVGGGASAIPRLGGAVARGIAGGFAADIATHMPELGTVAGEASVTGTPEEQQKAFTDVGVSALMGGLAGAGAAARARPVIPPRIVEAIAKGDQAGLTKATQTVADVVKREAPIEPEILPPVKEFTVVEHVPATVDQIRNMTPEQLMAHAEDAVTAPAEQRLYLDEMQRRLDELKPAKGVTDASTVTSPESAAQREIRPPMGEEAPLRQQGEAPIAREPARAQGGEEGQVLLKDVAREKEIATAKEALLESEDVMTITENPQWMELSKEFETIKNRYEGQKPSDVASGRVKTTPTAAEKFEVSVQAEDPAYPGTGFVQIVDTAVKAENVKSPTVESLRAAGMEVPDFSKLPTGKYTWKEAIEKAKAKTEVGGARSDRAIPETTKPVSDVPAVPEGVPAAVSEGRPQLGQPAVGAAEVPAQVTTPVRPDTRLTYIAPANGAKKRFVRQGGQWFKEVSGKPSGKALDPEIGLTKALERQDAARRAQPFFERESEATGLGRSSLPPTVADVRAQQVADTKQRAADAAAESGYVPDTRGETVKMRKSAERAVESPQIPEPVQERIEAAPESRYTQQSMARVDDAVKTMSDADLAATPADSNLYVASKLEQADRRFRAGDNDGGYAIFVELEKQGTSFGQNINQFKRLAGTRPEYVATVIDKHLTKAGKDALTPEQRATAIETTRKSKEADLALDKATDAWTRKPTAENAREAEAALDKANAEAVELQKFVAKFEPRSTSGILKSVLQGNLLTPISEVANLFGNFSFLPFRAGTRAVATGLDMIDAALRNKPRELSVQPLAGTAEALKGVGRGAAKIPDILIEGTGNVIKGETRAGLHPIKAWINQFAKNPEMPTTGGKLTLQDRLNLAIEGTFGVTAEAMLRGLGSGDVPFKEGARARVTAEQLRLNNVPRGQWPFAQKFPELFLDKKALEQIGKDTAAAVFQRESKTLNVITNWLRGKGEIVDFLAATVAPYKLTPWNIIGEIMSYNPLIAMTRGAIDAKKGNTRSAKLNAGKMVVGSMLTGAGVWLYNKGLLAPSLDQRDEAQKGRVLAGEVLPPNHINISGLKRALEGGDPTFKAGDETADIMRGGGLAGSIFYMTANIGRDFERQPEVDQSDMWLSILRQSTLEQARFGMNQSFLSGVEGLLTAIKDGNSDNYVRQWANTVGSIVLPNTLNTISRASREYKPDVSKDFPAQIKSKLGVFGLDDYLPLKRDFWGEPMRETPEGRDAIFYHFFDISKNKQVTSDPVKLELYRLWRKTANSEVIPSIPTRKLTIENQEYPLTPKLYEQYAEVVGKNRREIVDAMVINPNFHELTDEQKIDVLERAYRDGLARGKALFYQEHQGELVPKAGRAGFNAGLSIE